MNASDYRLQARQALQGNWLLAAGVTFVAALLGGGVGSSSSFDSSSSTESLGVIQNVPSDQWLLIILVAGIIILATFAYSCFVGGVVNTGYHKFHLNIMDGVLPEFSDLFSRFKKGVYLDTVKLVALQSLCIFGLTLLFVIPGIIAIYSYAMSYYVMLEHPELSPWECMKVSKAMMEGNRWRLFCLEFSFIGWAILSALTFGIGGLFLTPYTFSAQTAFYRSVRDSVDIQNYL